MKIEDFCARFGSNSRNINEVTRQWQIDELDELLRTLSDEHGQLIDSAVIVGDALHGDGMLDQIPRGLHDAFFSLMKEKADTYEKMRQILRGNIQSSDGGFLSFDNPHVRGFISKIKGQIGENTFQRHVGTAAELAHSGSQEGWDVAVKQADGLHEYVQVKLYTDPHKVVAHMLKVQQKVLDGRLTGVDNEMIHRVYFAVPEDISEQVHRLADTHPGLSDMLYEKNIPISAHGAADFVTEGMSNVGPDELSHFFHELLGGAVAAGSLHAIVNGFLWYKGAKEFSDAFASAAASTTISAAGIGMGLVAETFFHTAMLSSGFGIGTRFFLGRVARSRWNFAEFLEESITRTGQHIGNLRRIGLVAIE